MNKAGIVVLAASESHADMGRIANALEAAKEMKESGDEVKLIFDGAGTEWVGKLADPNNMLNPLYKAIEDKIEGACAFCAESFGVKGEVQNAGVTLLEEYDRHPSIRKLVNDGYQVITF